MGSSITNKYEYIGKSLQCTKKYVCCIKPTYNLLMVSLDAAGKTTLLYNLKQGIIVSPIPTIGFNAQIISFEKNKLHIWDVGGGSKIKQLWKHYLQEMKGILYIIDLSDRQRLDYSLSQLKQYLLSEKKCKDLYFFFFGTKKDLVQSDDNIYGVLQEKLTMLMREYKWQIRYVTYLNRQELLKDFQEINQILNEETE